MNKTWKKSQYVILKQYSNEEHPTPEVVNGVTNTIQDRYLIGVHKNEGAAWIITDLMTGCAIVAPASTQREAKALVAKNEQAIGNMIEKNRTRESGKIPEFIKIIEDFKHEQGLEN